MKDDERKDAKRGVSPKPADQKKDVPLQPAGETEVRYDETATRPPEGKQIHRRRPLPPIPEKGAERDSVD